MRTLGLVLGLLAALTTPLCVSGSPPMKLDDADLVVVLPAVSRREARQMQQLLTPWATRVRRQHRQTVRLLHLGVQPFFRISYVSLSDIPRTGVPAAEDVRQYLRGRFTSRPTTTERPRYLAIAALPYPEYGDAEETVQLLTIPRFRVLVRGVEPQFTQTETDVPYGFLAPETIDGGDGFVDPEDLDMRGETFTVFRIPLAQTIDVRHFVSRSNDFARATYHSDVLLVSGEFGEFGIPGDTSIIQCINATQLSQLTSVGRVFKVLNHSTCPADFLATEPNHRLADFLRDQTTGFNGGVIYDVSHGNADAIYGIDSAGGAFFQNLGSDDLDHIPTGRLNAFVSISCDNDAPVLRRNFAMDMYLHDSVAVVSATQSVFPTSLQAILDAEVSAFVALYREPVTILQALHRFHAEYYANYVIGGPVDDRPHNWINLLAVHVLGDGLTIVSK
jgi:hypothetical protein